MDRWIDTNNYEYLIYLFMDEWIDCIDFFRWYYVYSIMTWMVVNSSTFNNSNSDLISLNELHFEILNEGFEGVGRKFCSEKSVAREHYYQCC